MTFVSLFAGVEGFGLGFEQAGMRCVGQVEKDAHCQRVLSRHFPHVPKWSDIHEITGADLGHPALLVGGFPCQDYSVAGLRSGLAGDRGALWWQFARLIDECRPRWVVGENVPGLLSSNDGRDFGTIVGSLVELGYGVCWRILDAQWFGVPQRRRRVFIVGHSRGVPRPEILFEPEGLSGDSPPRREARQGVAPTLASRTRGGGGLRTDTDLDGGLIAATLETRPTSDRLRVEEGYLIAQTVTSRTGGRYDPETEALLAFNWQAGGSKAMLAVNGTRVSALHVGQIPAIAFAQNQRDEIGELSVAGSVNAERWGTAKNETLLATSTVRRLTPLECERLQGFPDNWTAGQSDTQRYRQMGNAVAVPVAEWIGHRLAVAEGIR